MNKKSQVSIFLIVSATIILALIAIFVLTSTNSKAPVSTSIVIANSNVPQQIKPYIDDCMTYAAHEALWTIGANGGYFNATGVQHGLYPNGYHYYDGVYLVPADSVVEEELGKAFNSYIIDCLAYVELPEGIILKEEGNSSSDVSMYDSSVVFSMKYPLSVTIGGTKTSFDSFSHTAEDIRLKLIIDMSRELTLQQMEDPDYVCMSCAANYATDNFMNIDLSFTDNSTVIYTFTDLDSNIGDEYYSFIMEHKYAE